VLIAGACELEIQWGGHLGVVEGKCNEGVHEVGTRGYRCSGEVRDRLLLSPPRIARNSRVFFVGVWVQATT
jgi:hypothetical protein